MDAKKGTLVVIVLALLIIGASLVIYDKMSITGLAVKDSSDLELNPECSDQPGLYKVWRIKNKNDFNVSYDWNLQNDSQNGSGIAEPGKSYFNTTDIDGENILELIVNDSIIDTKLWDPDNCEICIENWTCSNWSECINQIQTRECSDSNFCDNISTLPVIAQNCTIVNQTNNQTGNETNNETGNQTESEESPAEQTSAVVDDGGGGGGGGSSKHLPLIVEVEEVEQVELSEQAEEIEETETGIETPAPLELEPQTGFVGLVGNTVNFFGDKGIDYTGFSLLAILLIMLICLIIARRKYELINDELANDFEN